MKKLLIPLLLVATPVLASVENREARSLAMGGTGVASAHPGAASLYNPALLSHVGEEREWQFFFTPLGAALSLESDAQEAYDKISNDEYLDGISTAIDGINTAVSTSDLAMFQQNSADFTHLTRDFSRQMGFISGQPLDLGLGSVIAFGSAGQSFGLGVHARRSAQVEMTPEISACDRNLLNEYARVVEQASLGSFPTLNETYTCDGQVTPLITAGVLEDVSSQLTSSFFFGGAMTTEIGLSLSHAFAFGENQLAVGITPKYVNVVSYVVMPTIQNLDDENYDVEEELRNTEVDEDSYNMDIGLATSFFDRKLSLGLVARNLISQSYETPADANGVKHTFDIKPQATAGVAYQVAGLTLTSDLDLTKNKAFFNDSETQYLGLGAEYSLFKMLDFRVGARSNLAESDPLLLTAGLRFFFVSISAEYSKDQVGLALQFP